MKPISVGNIEVSIVQSRALGGGGAKGTAALGHKNLAAPQLTRYTK